MASSGGPADEGNTRVVWASQAACAVVSRPPAVFPRQLAVSYAHPPLVPGCRPRPLRRLRGCLGGRGTDSSPPGSEGGGEETVASAPGFQVPTQLNGSAFEPSIEVGPEGAIYVTAPSPPENESRTASWLWVSRDGGETWEPPSEYPVGPPSDPRSWRETCLSIPGAGCTTWILLVTIPPWRPGPTRVASASYNERMGG